MISVSNSAGTCGTETRSFGFLLLCLMLAACGGGSDVPSIQGGTPPAPPAPVPTVSLAANPTSVASGGDSILTWSSTNATSCTASDAWSGSKALSGNESTGALTSTSTFGLACTGLGGTANASATVTVPAAAAIFGLDFPGSAAVSTTMRFRFLNPLAIYPATYIWRAFPRQQDGFYTAFFWGNDDGQGNLNTFLWKAGVADSYYGAHPYPRGGLSSGTVHDWEIAIEQSDPVNGLVVKNQWYTQVFIAYGDGSGKHHTFYWNWPNTDPSNIVTYDAPTTWGNVNPPVPALTWGDAPWQPGEEVWKGILRGFQFYDVVLSPAQIAAEIANPGSVRKPWYLNLNPTPTDITDKSGNGHDPEWVGNERPSPWSQ